MVTRAGASRMSGTMCRFILEKPYVMVWPDLRRLVLASEGGGDLAHHLFAADLAKQGPLHAGLPQLRGDVPDTRERRPSGGIVRLCKRKSEERVLLVVVEVGHGLQNGKLPVDGTTHLVHLLVLGEPRQKRPGRLFLVRAGEDDVS